MTKKKDTESTEHDPTMVNVGTAEPRKLGTDTRMMVDGAPPSTNTDDTTRLPSGTRVLTIPATAGTDYICDNFSIQHPTSFIDQRDQYNSPVGGVLLDDFMTGSATLQLAKGSTRIPVPGDQFSEPVNAHAGTGEPVYNWYVTEVSKPEERASLQKVTINFRRKYN